MLGDEMASLKEHTNSNNNTAIITTIIILIIIDYIAWGSDF